MKSFSALVKHARSCRRFRESDPIPPQLVRDLVDLARLVPSAANQQPLRYRIVTGAAACAQVFPHTKWAGALKDWSGPAVGQRPTAYLFILAEQGKNVSCDVGIAAQTIQLAATAAGYAACMLGAIDRPALQAALNFPPPMEIQLLLALGRPNETIVLEDLPLGSSTNYYRTPDSIHHVPKRRLNDILL